MPRPSDSNSGRSGQQRPKRQAPKPSKDGKPASTTRGGGTGRTERAARPTAKRVPRTDSGARRGQTDRAGRPGGTGRADRTGRSDRTERPERTERTPGTGGPARPTRAPRPAAKRTTKRVPPPRRADPPVRKGWGSVARKGARVVGERGEDAERAADSASAAWRAAMARAREEEAAAPREPWAPDEWIEVDEEPETVTPTKRSRGSTGSAGSTSEATDRRLPRSRRIPRNVADELAKTVGAKRANRVVDRLADANRAYERDRYDDARRILKPLAEEAPGVAAVRQLLGLTAYRLGRWREAARELEAYQTLTGEVDQIAVLADSYRALGRHARVDQLWDDLRAASPSAEAVAEGRIVTAGSLADRGDLPAAIRLLEKAAGAKRHPKEHHLRQWYALADLYERAGDVPRARDLFGRVAANRPETFDVEDRLRSLR